MASREQPFSDLLDQALAVVPERTAPFLAEKKEVTFEWVQFPANRTKFPLPSGEKGGASICLSPSKEAKLLKSVPRRIGQ